MRGSARLCRWHLVPDSLRGRPGEFRNIAQVSSAHPFANLAQITVFHQADDRLRRSSSLSEREACSRQKSTREAAWPVFVIVTRNYSPFGPPDRVLVNWTEKGHTQSATHRVLPPALRAGDWMYGLPTADSGHGGPTCSSRNNSPVHSCSLLICSSSLSVVLQVTAKEPWVHAFLCF